MRRILLIFLAVASIGFLVHAVRNSYLSVESAADFVSLPSFGIALIPGTVMLILKAVLHLLITEDVLERKTKRWRVLSSYSQAQIVRYLPGKVWGIVYQGEQLVDEFPRRVVWLANIIQYVVTNINAVGVLGSIYCYVTFGPKIAIAVALGFLLVIYVVIASNLVLRVPAFLGLHRLRDMRKRPKATVTPQRALLELFMLQLEWIAYFGAWIWLLPNVHSAEDVVLIAAAYGAAALVGLLVIVMPSGWFVREAAFVWIGDLLGYGTELLLVYSIIGRLFFIIGDILCAITLTGSARLITEARHESR